MPVQSSLSDHKPDNYTFEIELCCKEIAEGKVGVVGGAEKLLQLLQKAGLTYTMFINPRQVGVDPINRGSLGLNLEEVLPLITEIIQIGWSWKAVAHAKCVEATPGSDELEAFNASLVKGSKIVAPVEANTIQFGSITCGHTNQGLRAIQAQLASSIPELSRDGKLDLEAVRAKDPEMADAVYKGLEWTVLRHEVRQRFPKVLEYLSEAGNNNIARQPNEVQGLLMLHTEAKKTNDPDWVEIKKKVLRNLPVWKDEYADLVCFAVAKSGGPTGHFLAWLKKFHSTFVRGGRRVHGSLYGALADFPHIFSAYAILGAAYTCPAEKMKYGVCDWFGASAVNRQKKEAERSKWATIEEILEQALRALLL